MKNRNVFLLALAVSIALFAGCSSTPAPWETKFYDIKTNTTPVIVATTNAADNVITYRTNVIVEYIYTFNTNAVAAAQIGGSVAAPFGLGGVVASGLLGIASIWGAIRSRRLTKVAAGLVQGIEVASEVLRTTPQGNELDEKLKTWLQAHQAESGTIASVLALMNSTVDNAEAREVAAKLKAEIEARSLPPKT